MKFFDRAALQASHVTDTVFDLIKKKNIFFEEVKKKTISSKERFNKT